MHELINIDCPQFHFENIHLYCCDCMELMVKLPGGSAELCLSDPPYGIGEDGGKCRTRESKKTNGKAGGWDNKTPPAEYFNEILRIGKNQIVFGGNYFTDKLPVSRGWLYWQKELGGDFADGELIWTSFDMVLRQYKKRSETFNRIHPTQKPVPLYEWLLKLLSKEGDRILDTHLGGAASAIAAFNFKAFEFIGTEIDLDYFNAGVNRFKIHAMQQKLF